MNLLSSPSLVESPFIIVKIGKYTFGRYTTMGMIAPTFTTKVMYPDYMSSIDIVKINGAVNTYTIKMVYAITVGDDPNLLEKVFSSVSQTRKIKISYGDCSSPSFIFREEEAIITNVQSSVDVSGSKISYIISCTSTSLALKAGSYNFSAYASKKPSDIIWDMLENKAYGITDIFYGMHSLKEVKKYNLIWRDDKEVKIEAKQKMNILDYLNYLVNCMSCETNKEGATIKDSRYYLTIMDTTNDELNGPYFKISKISNEVVIADTPETFEVDIGYPGSNLVTSFSINNNEAWSILYNYSNTINQSSYTYRLNDAGQLETVYSPNISTSKTYQYSTEADKSWWTNMTQYPISATMTIKGLIRPSVLMSYVRVNVWFYGSKHNSSGLYVITKQQDILDGSGYRTILSLTRVKGDLTPNVATQNSNQRSYSGTSGGGRSYSGGGGRI